MRNKAKSIIIFCSLAILAIVALAIISDNTRNYEGIDYTSYSVEDYGAKAFYLSVKEYGERIKLYDTERYNKYARFLPDDSLTVLVEPNTFIIDQFELNAIRDYVRRGNTLFFLTTKDPHEFTETITKDMKLTMESDSLVYSFESGKGEIVFFDGLDVLNSLLKKNNEKGCRGISLHWEPL